MQGGGEEEILRMTADTSGVVGPLEQVVGALDNVEKGITTLAGGIQILDADALGIDKIRQMLYGAEGATTGLGISTKELDATYGRLNNTLGMTAAGIDTFAADSVTAQQAMRLLAEQSRVAGDAMKTAFFEIDRGVAGADAMATAMTGLDEVVFNYEELVQTLDPALARTTEEIDAQAAAAEKAARAEAQLAQATLELGLTESEMADKLAKVATASTETAGAQGRIADALAGTKALTQEQVNTLDSLVGGFAKGRVALEEFTTAGFSQETVLAQLASLYLNTAMSEKEMVAAGVNMEAINAVIEKVVGGMQLLQASVAATSEGFKVVGDSAAAAGMRMEAESSATTASAAAHRSLVQTIADGVNEYITLAMVLQMVASAIGNFVSQGMQIEHTMNIIQGATQATDTQMQQWSSSMDQLGMKFGILQSDAAPALDLITRGGFEGAGATTVMSNAMELANTTGSKMADTTAVLTTALNVYGLGADQAHMVTQNLYSAFENSTLSMSQFDSFLQTSGLDAKGLGISIQDLLSTFGEVGNKVGGSNIALREMQGVLGGLSTFSDLTHAQLVKLAGGFDLTKFSAADASLKLLDLAKAANGNESAFTKMIGGMGNAQTVMDDLGISTKQLAINAANLGLAFDPVTYNSLDAAGKLQYLAGVADYSDSRFKALTKGGLENVNAALVNIMSSLDAAGQHLADTSAEFDKAKFNSEDFAQKLHQMADFLGGTGTAAFATYVGGAKNVPLALAIMGQEADNTGQRMSKAAADIARSSDTMRTHVDTSSQSFKDMDSAAGKTSMDAQTQSQAIGSAWQHLSDNFVRTYGPNIASGLQSIATGIDQLANGGQTTKAEDNMKGLFAEFSGPITHPTTPEQMTANMQQNAQQWSDIFAAIFGQTIPNEIRKYSQSGFAAAKQYADDLAHGFRGDPWQAGIRADVSDLYGRQVPILIRGQGPAAYQAELDYLHQLAHPDPGWEAGIRSEVDSTFAKNIPLLIRSKGPAAYQAELDYLHQLAHPDSGWESGVRSEVDSTFSKDVPGIMRNAAPSAHQAELDYLHQLANPPTSWENDIKNQVDDLFGNNIPAKIRNHAPDAYQATLDYLHQMSTGASTGNQQIVDNTGKTYKDDVPAAISSGQGPSDTAVKKITDGQSRAWKQLHTDLVGSSIVPDMMTAITAAIAAGAGPSSTAAALVTAAVQTVFAAEAAPAYTSGLNAADQFAAGITAGKGAAVSAASDVAAAVAGVLAHHSPPKEGPMKDDDTWMPNMMNMFASGITNNIGKMQLASHQAALAVGGNFNLSSSSSSGMSTAPMVSILGQILNTLRQQNSQGAIGRSALPANLGSVTQQFGSVNFNSNMSPQQLYAQLNKLSGLALEDASRGAVFGMGY